VTQATGNGDLRGVVAIGASAGGVEALSNLAAGLSPDVPYAYLVALHIPANAPSVLARIIDRSGPLTAVTAQDGAPLLPAQIYVGGPDRHLMVADHRVVLSHGPKENGHRPALNALFRSVALTFGPRAIGVLLSGVLDDGVLGLAAIRKRGGVTIGQSPADAMFPMLPTNAADAGVLDQHTAAGEIGIVLKELSLREIEESTMEPDAGMELENRIAMASRFSTDFETHELGAPSGYTCPDCNGSLVLVDEGNFRCRVGHAWTSDALLAARDEEVDGALWIALRSLQEKARLARHLAGKGHGSLSLRYTALAEESERALKVLSDRLSNIAPGGGGGG